MLRSKSSDRVNRILNIGDEKKLRCNEEFVQKVAVIIKLGVPVMGYC